MLTSWEGASRAMRACMAANKAAGLASTLAPVFAVMGDNRVGRFARSVSAMPAHALYWGPHAVTKGWQKHHDAEWLRSLASDCLYGWVGTDYWNVARIGTIPLVWCDTDGNRATWSPASMLEITRELHSGEPMFIGSPGGKADNLSFEVDTEFTPPGISPLAQAIIDDVDADGFRSHLLWGPKGTGKSCAARQAAREISKGSWVTLEASAVSSDHTWALLHTLRPRVIMLDDPELSQCDRQVREGIRRARGYAKLLIAAVNSVSGVRGSLLRPGRFDRVHHVADSPPCVLAAAGRGLPQDVLNAAKEAKLVAAYVGELAYQWRRHGWSTLEQAKAEISSLASRMADSGDR